MNVDQFLTKLKASRFYAGQIVHAECLPGREARYASLSPEPNAAKEVAQRQDVARLKDWSILVDEIAAALERRVYAQVDPIAYQRTLAK